MWESRGAFIPDAVSLLPEQLILLVWNIAWEAVFFLSPINVILKCSQCRGHLLSWTADDRVSQAVGLVGGQGRALQA